MRQGQKNVTLTARVSVDLPEYPVSFPVTCGRSRKPAKKSQLRTRTASMDLVVSCVSVPPVAQALRPSPAASACMPGRPLVLVCDAGLPLTLPPPSAIVELRRYAQRRFALSSQPHVSPTRFASVGWRVTGANQRHDVHRKFVLAAVPEHDAPILPLAGRHHGQTNARGSAQIYRQSYLQRVGDHMRAADH